MGFIITVDKGGNVVAITTYRGGMFSAKIAVSLKTIKDLKEKFGHEEIRNFIRGFDIAGELEALTEGQAKQIYKFSSLNSLRDRVSKEGYERVFPPDEGTIQGLSVSPATTSPTKGKGVLLVCGWKGSRQDRHGSNRNPTTRYQI